MEDTLIIFGSEVKALGDGKVSGYLVKFGDPANTDLEREFFTAETDFGHHKSSAVLYQHGMDYMLKSRVLCSDAPLKFDAVGVWIDAQMEMRDDYERAIYGMVENKKMGWSSGTASHLVEREKVGNAFHIKRWPLGLDASLTPTPSEPNARAVSLKTFDFTKSGLLTGLDYDDHSDTVLAAMREYVDRAKRLCERRTRDGRTVSDDRRNTIKQLGDEIADLLVAMTPETTAKDMRVLHLDYIRMEAEMEGLLQGASA